MTSRGCLKNSFFELMNATLGERCFQDAAPDQSGVTYGVGINPEVTVSG